VTDHLGLAAPFPALVAAADVTSIRLGTFVLNAGILHPAYLARDVADVYRLTDGRLELGLGAGYVQAEFEAVGASFGTAGERLRKLEAILTETRTLLAAEADNPQPPIMLGGAGDRFDDVELNLFVAAVGESEDKLDLAIIRQASGLDDAQLVQLPGVLVGSPREIADRLLRYREEFGVSYTSVLEPHMAAFAEVIKHLR
jgi:alkanesulfonate monooxygenase SsuD/methylene tetrahydromethanopterin reductase-like flavin-dependent oxidoreductase (luciferase family)